MPPAKTEPLESRWPFVPGLPAVFVIGLDPREGLRRLTVIEREE